MDENLITKGTNILLETGTNELEILEFFLDESDSSGKEPIRTYFGMNVAKVMEVIEAPEIKETSHDRHPSFLGVINLRDHALPLIDLGRWLGMKRIASKFDVIIVTQFSQAKTGFLVTGVTEIHRVGWGDVSPPAGYLGQVAIGSLVGTVQRNERFIQLLDLESILADLDPTTTASFMTSAIKAPRPYKVLVADDSPTIRNMLEKNLGSADLDVSMTGDGKSAWGKLEEYKATSMREGKPLSSYVEIVVSDIEMPQMDGFSLTKRIKEDEVLRELPVILYSSIITDELRHKGERVGADAQISKPELPKMSERIMELMAGKA